MLYHFFLLAFTALVSIYAGQKVVSYLAARRFIKANDCKPPHKLPQSERIFGYSLFKTLREADRTKTLLENGLKRFADNANTFELTFMGATRVQTIEPENIKHVLATRFQDFGLGTRLKAFGPLLGSGIFTTDGAHWELSRVSSGIIDQGDLLTCIGTCPPKLHKSPGRGLKYV